MVAIGEDDMQLNSRKVLVTGGAGFIGSHTCKRLLQEGATVLVFDNSETGKKVIQKKNFLAVFFSVDNFISRC